MIKLAQNWPRRLVPLSKIASSYHLSPFFLKRIARALKRAKLIKSKEGANGGYALARHPKTVSLGKILQVFAGPQILSPGCLNTFCPVKKCPPKIVWQKINKEILKSLEKISLLEVAQ